jgi:hypothetical protein
MQIHRTTTERMRKLAGSHALSEEQARQWAAQSFRFAMPTFFEETAALGQRDLYMRIEQVNGLWQSAIALGVYDQQLWTCMDIAWDILTGALAHLIAKDVMPGPPMNGKGKGKSEGLDEDDLPPQRRPMSSLRKRATRRTVSAEEVAAAQRNSHGLTAAEQAAGSVSPSCSSPTTSSPAQSLPSISEQASEIL